MAGSLTFVVPAPLPVDEPEITYVASTVPAKKLYVSGTNLFRIAASQFGDALQWGAFAAMNGILDPWIYAQAVIKVPPVPPTKPSNGIYAPLGAF